VGRAPSKAYRSEWVPLATHADSPDRPAYTRIRPDRSPPISAFMMVGILQSLMMADVLERTNQDVTMKAVASSLVFQYAP